MVSQNLQKYGCCVLAKLTTLDKQVPYSKYLKDVSPTNSSMKKAEKQSSLASPTRSQTSKKLHPTKHEQTYNGAKGDPQIAHHNDTSNTN